MLLQEQIQDDQGNGAEDGDSHSGAVVGSILVGVKQGNTDGDHLQLVVPDGDQGPQVGIPVIDDLQDGESRHDGLTQRNDNAEEYPPLAAAVDVDGFCQRIGNGADIASCKEGAVDVGELAQDQRPPGI